MLKINLHAAIAAALSLACAAPGQAQVLARKDLSSAMAVTIATTAAATCKAQGFKVSVHVVGRLGEILVAIKGDDAPPHTMENSFRKAYTARTTRAPSGEMAKRIVTNPTMGQVHLTNIIASQGALPITIGDDVIGAVGVSGAPGGDKDEACAKTGIDTVAADLK